MAGLLDYYFILKFVKELVTPFNKTKAYKLGIIDADGNILRPMDELKTSQEKAAYSYTNRLVWNLKKLLGKLPGGKSSIASFAAAMWLLKEELNISDVDMLCEELQTHIPTLLTEQSQSKSVNTVTIYKLKENLFENGDIGDTIIFLNNKPVTKMFNINIYEAVNLTKKEYVYIPGEIVQISEEMTTTAALPDTSTARNKFAGVRVFPVKGKTYCRCLQGKKKYARWKNYLDLEDENDNEVLNYAKKNPNKDILVRSLTDGSMVYLKNHSYN